MIYNEMSMEQLRDAIREHIGTAPADYFESRQLMKDRGWHGWTSWAGMYYVGEASRKPSRDANGGFINRVSGITGESQDLVYMRLLLACLEHDRLAREPNAKAEVAQ